jgi:hypothetical protein
MADSEQLRDDVADVLTTIAKDGLPGPRDLDVALDAIFESFKAYGWREPRDDDAPAPASVEGDELRGRADG